MRFEFTEEQEMICDMVRDFVAKEVETKAEQLDEAEAFDRGMFDRMAALGFTGLPWPESDGGAGGGFASYVLLLEQLSGGCASLGAALWTHVQLVTWPVYRFGQHGGAKQLQALIEGRKLGAGALPPRPGGLPPLAFTLAAKPDGDGYVLDGTQEFVINGTVADLFLVYANVEGEGEPERTAAFLVERGMAGLQVRPVTQALGLRSSGMAHLTFDRCRLSEGQLIGSVGQGAAIAGETWASARYGLAALAAGIAQGALKASLAYAKERTQFGKPIARHQAVAFMLAEMCAAAEASSLLVRQAAWNEDKGLGHAEPSARALAFAADAAVGSTTNAVQILGGYGYMKEYRVERYMRDAKALHMLKGMGVWAGSG
ncbi:acyl-CoA dehydrogenase family protein [Paenibacillus sp. MZ04-78.2]|uniref:acyl-CoA dehydrogenase family protein n=1 Tax=Paenibacillus sp. MZ04-78.2 TaxID=2962034 RepID=UPI0020B8D8CE|nr:acyl-CoA dehydrogenase family protein [Paenibacillus sp. MZ04-78.2]MCP3775975.1 acyl-CoA dehydrogenase family protein [Paenibacillus sp. MZ04-78.2]